MNGWAALRGLGIGCVQYLNAQPLIHGCTEPVTLAHPSELARQMASGALDAALVPVFEAFGSRSYALVDGVAIASDGPVFSVFLAHRVPLSEIRSVALDPASLTSVNLLRVLLAEFHGLAPEFVAARPELPRADARLLIGNQAIEFRNRAGEGEHFLDLGAEWKRCTGLPFVYAFWLLQPNLRGLAAVADAFRALQQHGLECLEEIVTTGGIGETEFRRRYLTEHIRFGLGPREKAGLDRFRELLVKHQLIAPDGAPLIFV